MASCSTPSCRHPSSCSTTTDGYTSRSLLGRAPSSSCCRRNRSQNLTSVIDAACRMRTSPPISSLASPVTRSSCANTRPSICRSVLSRLFCAPGTSAASSGSACTARHVSSEASTSAIRYFHASASNSCQRTLSAAPVSVARVRCESVISLSSAAEPPGTSPLSICHVARCCASRSVRKVVWLSSAVPLAREARRRVVSASDQLCCLSAAATISWRYASVARSSAVLMSSADASVICRAKSSATPRSAPTRRCQCSIIVARFSTTSSHAKLTSSVTAGYRRCHARSSPAIASPCCRAWAKRTSANSSISTTVSSVCSMRSRLASTRACRFDQRFVNSW
eukprot:Unigene9084_Nuclearia_a/m.27782 Unigene9084_Nuclearia_a/g.27782  ORF Unigene9084_Nuclearia_a/g.27782 Unigene9084_Nuclearia_a/m.27782 type:complete len:338 (-) Unigene9084_Nuclearia_a:3348-4361(-)